ncbi:AAA domain-containing protein [Glutamicibacter sp.]|uniref:DEAD/DEAH box helicase n=1 Tax=Glutamicibacter sp. TaxID=1931995 RepID=UPI003D6A18A8
MATALQVADYFSKILRRGRLEEVQFKESEPFITTPRQQLKRGMLSEQDTELLFKQRASARHSKKAQENEPAESVKESEGAADPGKSTPEEEPRKEKPLSVVLSLVTLEPEAERPGSHHTGLLLLAAKLFPDGRLIPELVSGSTPWIPSPRLDSPMVSGLPVMVGSLEDFWQCSRSYVPAQISQAPNLGEAIDLATKLFEAVSRQKLPTYVESHKRQGQSIETELCFVQSLDRINAVGGILDAYDFLEREAEVPALVQRVVDGWSANRVPEGQIQQGDGLLQAAKRSCGSMSDGFPLTASQRRAVHAHLMETEGEITAVNGPPGTGKTTMLQSIVANLITSRALGQQEPPVIVGSSTNNQAVTNVISSFASVTKQEPGDLDYRWLPMEKNGQADANEALASLAVYCPSQAKLDEAKRTYLVEQPGKSYTYSDYINPEYIAGAKDRFVFSAFEYFGISNDIPELQIWIHDALTQLERYRIELLETMHAEGRSENYLDLCRQVQSCPHLQSTQRVAELQECRNLEELDQLLDVTLRYAQFWLAVHYFEAQWLLIVDPIEPEERFKNTKTIMGRYWRQAAALTPCFVMTLYQVPKYFKLYEKPDAPTRFDLGRIDLLIVDEAGQVDTSLALPALALAQRAVIVGDENQLSPVWSIDELTDAEIAESSGIPRSSWEEDLCKRGMSCSAPSSLMRAASHASAWSYGENKPGLFLAEHFRCHPGIIEFCNELIYDGLLDARRPAKASKLNALTEAFLFTVVPDSNDTRNGSSRENLAEAKAVAEWIVQNYMRFFDLYHHQEPVANDLVAAEELIGVVTPFSAQARLISRELENAARASTDPELPEESWKLITVGTAHKLQGAERPIILFSAAYGQNSAQSGFIDANPELMNVAASRAKDLLIVFASENRWGTGRVFETMAGYAHQADAAFPQLAQDAPAEEPEPRRLIEPGQAATEAGTHPASADPVALSAVVDSWRESGVLRAEDVAMKAANLNQRLAKAGVLEGNAGAWKPSVLARVLGVVTEERNKPDGSTYQWTGYTQSMQELLRTLYLDGKL